MNKLLRRLSDAFLPTWPQTWWWHSQPTKADYERVVDASKNALDAIRGTGDWRAIPSLLHILSHDAAVLRNAAGSVIAELAALIPIAALPSFERRLRESTLQAYLWNQLRVEWVAKQEWPPHIWAMFTMHPSGYMREAALRHLASTGDAKLALPYILLRVNDWVSQVRAVAVSAVMMIIHTKQAAPWGPVLGLVTQLQLRSRADHAWLSEAITSLLLHPDSRPELVEAIKSEDRDVARWAFATSLNLPEIDRGMFIWLAIESTDAVVRMRVAAAVRAWKECPGREQLLEKMASDPFMPVCREALYAALDRAPESRRCYLRAALLDRRASMRHAARLYLRDEPGQTGDPFDARTFYLDAIAKPGVQAAAIAGLGECGNKADAELLVKHLAERLPSIAAAAVRAIALLDQDSRIALFVELLHDERPSVAREACRALSSRSNLAPVEALRKVLQSAKRDYSRRLALRLLLRRHPYDAVVDAILAVGSGDATLAQLASEFAERATPWRVPFGPSEAQKLAALQAFASTPQPLPENIRKRLRDFMGLPSA